jgi:hypothetical protein
MLNRFQRKPKVESSQESHVEAEVFGREVGLITRLIGCYHRQLSRPFVERGISYKSCLHCGARKPFDPKTFESGGKFYYPPVTQL